MSETIRVEVVHARPERQWSVRLSLAATATIADALSAVAAEPGFADLDLARASGEAWTVGVWGKVVGDRAHRLRDGDRVEIYRPLAADPKDARRQRSTHRGQARSHSVSGAAKRGR